MAVDFNRVERAILGSVILDPQRCLSVAITEGIASDWFTADSRRLAWDAILALWVEHKPVDPIAVIERAQRIAAKPKTPLTGVELAASEVQAYIDETPTTAHLEHYIYLARGEVIDRRIKKAGARYNEDRANGIDSEGAARALSQRLTAILSATVASKTISLPDICEKIRAKYAEAHQKRIVEKDLDYTPGIPLPWKGPNTASQGVQEGLYYLGARPSVGKTAFILNVVRYWCERGVKVAFNTLDMAIVPMIKRPIAELSRVSLTKASFGTTTHTDLEAIDRAIDGEKKDGARVRLGVKDWPLTLLQERDVETFRSWCVAAHGMGALDVVIVDFVQLMGTRARYANDNEKLEHISGVLKSIAIDLDIPVIALSQLNRACEEDGGRVPTASDLRGSGALEQDATAVWILHSDRDVIKTWTAPNATPPLALTANQTPEEMHGLAPVRFIIAKNQNGQAGADIWFPFVFYKKYCLFMLADFKAQPLTITTGTGAAAKTTFDYSPKYARVTHDWRCDPFERVLYDHGALVGYDLRNDRFLLGEES